MELILLIIYSVIVWLPPPSLLKACKTKIFSPEFALRAPKLEPRLNDDSRTWLISRIRDIAPHLINTVCRRDALGDLILVRQFLAFRENENFLLCVFPAASRWLRLRSLVGAAPV